MVGQRAPPPARPVQRFYRCEQFDCRDSGKIVPVWFFKRLGTFGPLDPGKLACDQCGRPLERIVSRAGQDRCPVCHRSPPGFPPPADLGGTSPHE